MSQCGILINLNRCLGCYSCEVGCKEWHNIPGDKKWIRVKILGPKKINGKLKMDFYIEISDDCNFCDSRIKEGLDPFCVTICPSQALSFCDTSKMLQLLATEKRYQICKIGTI
jgi:Fe-S-cluster-containing dehydrogenase component